MCDITIPRIIRFLSESTTTKGNNMVPCRLHALIARFPQSPTYGQDLHCITHCSLLCRVKILLRISKDRQIRFWQHYGQDKGESIYIHPQHIKSSCGRNLTSGVTVKQTLLRAQKILQILCKITLCGRCV